jgi:hypothetical protein
MQADSRSGIKVEFLQNYPRFGFGGGVSGGHRLQKGKPRLCIDLREVSLKGNLENHDSRLFYGDPDAILRWH